VPFGVAARAGALHRAWHLGMFAARDEAEREMLAELGASIDAAPAPEEPFGTVATDARRTASFVALVDRYLGLLRAWEAGMISAATPEQEAHLAELRDLMGDGDA
jgi:hypothetical protein